MKQTHPRCLNLTSPSPGFAMRLLGKKANSEWRIANSGRGPRVRRPFYSLFATRYSLLAFVMFAASPAAAIECAPYCDYTHDYGPYDLSWKRPGLYAFPVCAPNGECAPRAVRVYSPVSG